MPGQSKHNFEDGNGPVPAHRHPRGGGWVAESARVDQSATVTDGAWIFGSAKIFGAAKIFGFARVYGRAKIIGPAEVGGNVYVGGTTTVRGSVLLSGMRAFESDQILDEAFVAKSRAPDCAFINAPMGSAAVTDLPEPAERDVAEKTLFGKLDANSAKFDTAVKDFNEHGCHELYHLTSAENIASILTHGILPRNFAGTFIDIADSEVNARRQFVRFDGAGPQHAHDCVPMFFVSDPPMLFAIPRPKNLLRWVVVDIKRLVESGAHIVFTDGNLAATRSSTYSNTKDLRCLYWKWIRDTRAPWEIQESMRKDWKRKKAAEVLAFPKVPPGAIARILAPSVEAAYQTQRDLTAAGVSVRVDTDPARFPRS